MVEVLHYYFETLPVHPHPERLELFTSYLTRLAEANGLRSMGALASTCFFDEYVRTMRWQKDTPPVSLGQLPTAAVCHPSDLLTTTFFHLGKKLNVLVSLSHLPTFYRVLSLTSCAFAHNVLPRPLAIG